MATFFSFLGKNRQENSSVDHYFITLCTRRHMPCFGSVTNGQMDLSLIGKIVEFECEKMAKNVQVVSGGEWIVMPNHVHALFETSSSEIPVMVRRFKFSVKNWTNLCGLDFHWQTRYQIHRLKNEQELVWLRWYIRKNPMIWKTDSLYRENQLTLSGSKTWATSER